VRTARRIERLLRLIDVRHTKWLRLYRQPDVWTDTQKRRQMIHSRWQYHRALTVYLIAARPA
jgi:hypothetical protein